MILYFTGTGNSKYIADALADRLADEAVSLNKVFRTGKPVRFESEKPFVIVCPIYAWSLPRRVADFLRTADFEGNRRIYAVVTMGSQTGNAGRFCEKLFAGTKMEFMGLRGIAMPDNFVIASVMPDEAAVRGFLDRALPQADAVAEIIRAGKKLTKTDRTPAAAFLSGPVNACFNKYYLSDKKFAANDACTGCGLCASLCPVNNIRLQDGRPVFSGNCMACYACIHHCPARALNITGKTEKHGRYVCPEYKK